MSEPFDAKAFYDQLEAQGSSPGPAGDVPARRMVLTPASAIKPAPVVWAWEDNGYGRIAAGSLTLFAGREGTGKSSFLIWKAAKITTGTLPGSFYGTPRAVVYVAVEDSWKYTIVPRLMASGADLDLVYRAEVHTVEGETFSLSLPADNSLLKEAITGYDVALLALDPLLSSISDKLDTHVNRQVRQALDPLVQLADQTGAIIAGIAHFNKTSGTDASSLITGSGAFKDVARSIFAFAADDDGQVITQTKNSLGHSNLPSLAYRIIEAIVPTPTGDARVGRFVLDGQSERTVQDILSDQADRQDKDERARAEDYLRKALADGPRLSREIADEAQEVHSISPRTLKRARADLRIPAQKHGSEWWVSLPEHEGDLRAPRPAKSAKSAKDSTPNDIGIVGPLDAGKSANEAKGSHPGTLGTLGTLDGLEPVNTANSASGGGVPGRTRTRRALPDDKRQAILGLHAQGGLTQRQIAARAGVSLATANKVINEEQPGQ